MFVAGIYSIGISMSLARFFLQRFRAIAALGTGYFVHLRPRGPPHLQYNY